MLHRWVVTSLANIPSLTRAASIDVDRLEAELITAMARRHSQIIGADQCCAWTPV
jgi:hypothetical protein